MTNFVRPGHWNTVMAHILIALVAVLGIAMGAAPFLMTGIDTDLLLSGAQAQATRALATLQGV